MLNGALILWAVLTVLSFIFIVYDLIKNTPEAGVMKVGWALVVLYTGPIGLYFYFMTCREPIPGTHEKFIDSLWKQATGSEVHCLAGDATGIIIMAIFLSFYEIPRGFEIFLEYVAGFISGFLIFQALFMKKMMGGDLYQSAKKQLLSRVVFDEYDHGRDDSRDGNLGSSRSFISQSRKSPFLGDDVTCNNYWRIYRLSYEPVARCQRA